MQSDHLLDRRECCRYFGNINASTLYRGIKLGRYPRPVKVEGEFTEGHGLDRKWKIAKEMVGRRF